MKFIVEKGSKKRIKKNHEIAKNLGFKDISMSLEKDFSHVAYLAQCAGNIFFLISESWLTGNSVILSWKLKKKGKKANLEQLPACYFNS